jgi:hypothetical protein
MMTIQVTWDNEEKTVIRHDFAGPWMWEEFWEIIGRTNRMIQEVPHRVHIIANMREAVMPRGLGMMSNMRKATLSAPPNRGMIVVVVNPFLKTLLSLFMSFDPEMTGMMFSAESIEEARRVIAERGERVLEYSLNL